MSGLEKYVELYGREPEGVSFCPYRVSPLGAHIDHQMGIVNGFAIEKGITVYYGTKQNGVVELCSLSYDKRAQFFINAVEEERVGDWADYLRGVTKILNEKYRLTRGIKGVIEGSLPVGGLSSSAAVTISFLEALCAVNEITLSPWDIIRIAKKAENEYVGVNCGLLDQSTEVLSRRGHLFVLDTLDSSYSNYPQPDNMSPFKIAILFSGLERNLKSNNSYNLRQDECKAASYALLGYAGLEYGTFKDTVLRSVPKEVFEEYKDRLPLTWRKRAQHYFGEMERVEKGLQYWKEGNIEAYGSLVFESGLSSIENYECGCDELITLYNILKNTEGVLGARFSGAGFKGFVLALIEDGKENDVLYKVEKEYLKVYPGLTGKYKGYITRTSDGVEGGRV